MARYAYGGRTTCESCRSIDVRRWHRQGRLESGHYFSTAWSCNGEHTGRIGVRPESDAVVLSYRARRWGSTEWKTIEQRIPLTWTDCHFGGRRPWFVCSVYREGRYCGRRVAVLYAPGELFACRRCFRLAYTSQQQAAQDRGLWKAQKIRMRLGGSGCMADDFPEKPKGMHWRTYERLCLAHDVADARSIRAFMQLSRAVRRDRRPCGEVVQLSIG